MSTERVRRHPPCRSLGEYVEELVARLGSGDPAALARLRRAVGRRRARIRLDDETIEVAFANGRLAVEPPGGLVDGEGETDRQTVLDLLDGWLEITDAILDGRLRVVGTLEAVSRMFLAIEILLDGSARLPALQELARDFRADPCRPAPGGPRSASRHARWYPPGVGGAEQSLLERLDLLP
jgi:hypothetical protein